MAAVQPFPVMRQVVLDCVDPRTLAEFYRQLLGFAQSRGTTSHRFTIPSETTAGGPGGPSRSVSDHAERYSLVQAVWIWDWNDAQSTVWP